ncbi:MAG: hypothetical protein ACTSRP_01670 [Candidatus Helarchaeota archaeon]
MTVSEEILDEHEKNLESIILKLDKKYVELFKEICEERALDFNEELKARVEAALVNAFNSYHSECLRENKALGFLKGGKSCKRIPGFDIEHIRKMLLKMDSIDEQIEFLKNYVEGLQKTKETMYMGPRGLPTTMTREQQHMGLTPYMKVIPQAIIELQKIIRALEAEKIIKEKLTQKF